MTKRKPSAKKPDPVPDDTKPDPEPVRSTTVIRHDGRRVAAGVVVSSDDPIVARFPNLFEPVEGR